MFIYSLIGLELLLQHVQDLISGCPCLTNLDLSMSQHLQSFTGAISQVRGQIHLGQSSFTI